MPACSGGDIIRYFLPSFISRVSKLPELRTRQSISPLGLVSDLSWLPDALSERDTGDMPQADGTRMTRALSVFRRSGPVDEVALRTAHACLVNGRKYSSYRDSHVWVGGSVRDSQFVPPPVSAIQQLMQDFISFLAREDLPHNKIPLVYYQILCIHPFENGNGRLARALVAALSSRSYSNELAMIFTALLVARKRVLIERYFPAVARGNLSEYYEYWNFLIYKIYSLVTRE